MTARDRMQQAGDNIINLYSNLEERIFSEIINALKNADFANVAKEDVLKWQLDQLNKMGVLNERIIKLVANYDGLSQQAIYDFVEANGMAIIDESDQELQRMQHKALPISDKASDLLDALRKQTWDDLNNNVNQTLLTRNFGNSAPMRAYQAILKQATIESMTGLKTNEQAIKDAIYKQVDAGLKSNMVDKAGHQWSIEGYTRTVITTTVNRTYHELRTQRMQDYGQTLCVMSWHMASREACAPIQGHVVNMVPPNDPQYNPKYDSIYNHGYGQPSGTLGINCRHNFYPFSENINTNNQHPTVTPEEAIKNAGLQQKQRQYERSIRDAKKRLRVAEELGDRAEIIRAKTLIKNRQKRLRALISETNSSERHQVLARDYSREQIAQNLIEIDKVDKTPSQIHVETMLKSGQWGKEINPEKQAPHMESTRVEGKSYLYDNEDPQALLDEYAGKGRIKKNRKGLWDNREFVKVDHIVGIDYNTGEETDWIKIHHSKRRTHIVPFKKQMNGDDEDA